jgi:hypothetical protein
MSCLFHWIMNDDWMNRVITGDERWVFQHDKVIEHVIEISRLTSSQENADVRVKVKKMFMFNDSGPLCRSSSILQVTDQEMCVFLGITFYGIFCRTFWHTKNKLEQNSEMTLSMLTAIMSQVSFITVSYELISTIYHTLHTILQHVNITQEQWW